ASALMLLIFKDTLLGFVASVQIGSNDMLRIGDWIEMPSANADGEVMDISLHTVKVRNWDGTISTIPTWKLITESFKNWRGMFDSGGRRIKRSLFVNASTVRFLSEQEIDELSEIRLLEDYLAKKEDEVEKWNLALGEKGRIAANKRRLTNLGTFRAYTEAYLKAHPDIHHGMTCMVRQLATEGDGIPLELYCFTASTAWGVYEGVQSDIFDHLFSILPTFGLGLYQRPAGADFREGIKGIRAEAAE
ncbi:MAG: mechanosensitive ion channel, partial [Pedobacter sp.]|nr:mechanosensitive ion channel [Pedobacter sp.]